MKIRIVVAGQELPATLENNASAKAFAEMLPLDLKLDDYHGIEKVSDLPGSLPTHDAPAGIDPDVGDITLYAPWGNLAIFYRDFGYASGLVKLGRIEGGMAALSVKGSLNARIERVE
ncbi:cyclophilin-like fold protein [Marinobacterium lutimaris]|nr:cyclophilin-like fold protein [Marinobacterium lutimaris]